MSGGRFRYALQPVLLTRQWELDGLLVELGEANQALAQQRRELEGLRAASAAAELEWLRTGQGQQVLSVDRFTLMARYIADCRAKQGAMEVVVAQAERARDELIERITAARRALDAVEEHRDDMRGRFVRQRQSGDFKSADDQWGVMRAGLERHGD
ncbi:hypothetical protein [Pseudoduganella namucuonensis]|uniref:Flagellar FliJ protein n=1 Tax=Pseudoduganella namucuonensis TaxID=1035707 RepID=A0A1I7M456_9BURK|nr:hypothetical protein [Pseudoduganella namucuonensis]SFV16647.1 hypothetical protein SAMN05216552_105418 [Pseudoduganella namucuonensis]